MSAQRETASIWLYLRWGRKMPGHLWKSPYLFQDSFLTPFNRWIRCRLFGHTNVKDVSDCSDGSEITCFNCYTRLK